MKIKLLLIMCSISLLSCGDSVVSPFNRIYNMNANDKVAINHSEIVIDSHINNFFQFGLSGYLYISEIHEYPIPKGLYADSIWVVSDGEVFAYPLETIPDDLNLLVPLHPYKIPYYLSSNIETVRVRSATIYVKLIHRYKTYYLKKHLHYIDSVG